MNDFPLKRGINFDHRVDMPGEGLAQDKYIRAVADAGFDHIRLPLRFSLDVEGYKPVPEYFERIKRTAQMVVDRGLCAMIDVHPLDGMRQHPEEMKSHLVKLWEDMAVYLKDMDQHVVFEIFNEPVDPFNHEILNDVQNDVIKAIRKSNPTRLIAAATAHYNTIGNLKYLALPKDDENIFVTIHNYTPMAFTHQGANWLSNGGYPKGVRWGTSEERERLENMFAEAAEWSRANSRHIHLGEFGVLAYADPEYRALWTGFMTDMCERNGFGWCYWELSRGFGIYNLETGEWDEGMLKVLTKK